MNKKLIHQIGILLTLTIVIIACGIFIPKILIGFDIRANSKLRDSIEENSVSPYGMDVLAKEENLSAAYNYIDTVINPNLVREKTGTAYADPQITGQIRCLEEYFNIVESNFRVRMTPIRYRTTLSPTNQETGISEIYDGSLDTSYYYMVETESGIPIAMSYYLTSDYFPLNVFWNNTMDFYSEEIGVNVFEINTNTVTSDDADRGFTYGAASTIDNRFTLKMVVVWEKVAGQYGYTVTVLLVDNNNSNVSEAEYIINTIVTETTNSIRGYN